MRHISAAQMLIIHRNNSLSNLRLVTPMINSQNSQVARGKSKYRGVAWDKSRSKWIVTIRVGGKKKYLGRYDYELEAARVYREAQKEYHTEAILYK